MSIHLVTFSDESMSQSAALCAYSARKHGVDWARWWKKEELALTEEYQANRSLFDQPRGCGYWAFKPVIILDAMKRAFTDDLIIYADAGVEFIEPVSIIIDRMDQDIFLFGNDTEHAHWCKRDIVEAIWPLSLDDMKADPNINESLTFGEWWTTRGWNRFGKQVQASVIFFRVNDKTRAFVKEWLDWCLFEGGRLIDDSPSQLPNHPEFKENRHDQAILTTLAYREGYKLHNWYVRYDGYTPQRSPHYPDDNYGPQYLHHRKRNHQWGNAA